MRKRIRSLVCKVKSTRVSSPRPRRRHPAFRTQWLERLIPRSPRWTALSPPFWIVSDFHRHRDDGPSRSFRRQHRDAGTTRLWPSAWAFSGEVDFRFADQKTPQYNWRVFRPRNRSPLSRKTRSAPSSFAVLFTATNRAPQAATASRPAYRDDRETPLMTGQDEKEYSPTTPACQAEASNGCLSNLPAST